MELSFCETLRSMMWRRNQFGDLASTRAISFSFFCFSFFFRNLSRNREPELEEERTQKLHFDLKKNKTKQNDSFFLGRNKLDK